MVAVFEQVRKAIPQTVIDIFYVVRFINNVLVCVLSESTVVRAVSLSAILLDPAVKDSTKRLVNVLLDYFTPTKQVNNAQLLLYYGISLLLSLKCFPPF